MKEQPCWMEVRPLASGKFEVGNFAGLLDLLRNTGKPFRFYMANCPSVRVEGLRCVRFFLQLQSADLAERVAYFLRSNLDAEVIVGSAPPERVYESRAELGLKRHYAIPICQREGVDANPVDAIVGALSGGESALEVLVVEDRGARLGILKHIARLTGRSVSFADTLLNAAIDIPTSVIFGPPPPSKPQRKELTPVAKERVEAAGWKANQGLFRCEINLYGDARVVEALLESLPSSPANGFKIVRRRIPAPLDLKDLHKPRGRELKGILLSYLWAAPPILFILAWLFFGIVDPLRLANVDIFSIGLTVASALLLWSLFQKRLPLVLCTRELSLIAGLPTAVGRLPIEMGTARVTRGLLAFGEEPAVKPIPEPPQAEGRKMPEEWLHVEGEVSVKASAGRPVKIAGMLRDPETGAPLPNREFEVCNASGTVLYTDLSDHEGRFEVVYTPEKPETVKLEIRPRGCVAPSCVVEVSAV